ncbi:MAG: hypothetical protein OXI88_07305, partial [Gammaproteobacteria bacterium]|nr:hypothetical protein [Gammaproteobacteria bacterium]
PLPDPLNMSILTGKGTRYVDLLMAADGLVSGQKVEWEAQQLSRRLNDNFNKAGRAAGAEVTDEVYALYEQISNVTALAQSHAKKGVDARDAGERLKTLTGHANTLIEQLAQRAAGGAGRQGKAPAGTVAPEERTVSPEEKASARARKEQRLEIEKNQQEIDAELSALLGKPAQPDTLDELGKLAQRVADNDRRMEDLERAAGDSPDTAAFWNLANRMKSGMLEKLREHVNRLEDGPAPERQTAAPATAVLSQRIDDEIALINALDPDKSIRSRLGKSRVSSADRAELDKISAEMDKYLLVARDRMARELGELTVEHRVERVRIRIVDQVGKILDNLSALDETLVTDQRELADDGLTGMPMS